MRCIRTWVYMTVLSWVWERRIEIASDANLVEVELATESVHMWVISMQTIQVGKKMQSQWGVSS